MLDKKIKSAPLAKPKREVSSYLRPVIMLSASLVVVMLFLLLSGYDPTAILTGFKRAVTTDLAGSIRYIIPMILAGVAVCIPFKAQAFNLGVDGQIYVGAVAATVVGLALPESLGHFGFFIILLTGMAAGALYAMLAAALKVYFNVDLVVSTLLLNFVGELFCQYMAGDVLRDRTAILQTNASQALAEPFWLPRLTYIFGPTSANNGIYIAIIVAIIAAFIFKKTTLGYEIKIVGTNDRFAQYGGMKPNMVTLKVMALSGAVAGIVGVIEVSAIHHRLMAGFNPSFGFDGIVVALLANNSPLGVLLSGTFFVILKSAGNNMERVTEVPAIVTKITMAIIIMAISAQVTFKKRQSKKRKGGAKDGNPV